MAELNKPTFNYKTVILISGIVLILFGSLFAFTKSAYWGNFDFSQTGQIGDTIGGITAPIINVIGAILISFKAQLKANKTRFLLLSIEIENQKKDRNLQVILELFQSLKNDYFTKLEYANNLLIKEFEKHEIKSGM